MQIYHCHLWECVVFFKKYSDELQASGSFLKADALTLSSTLTFDPYSLSAVFNNGLQSINNSKLHLERIYLSKLFRNLILFFTVQYKRHFEPRMPQRFLKPDVTITDFLNSVNNVAVSLSSDYLTKCFVEAQICNLGVF